MQKKYDEIMQEIDSRMAGLDLNKKNIVTDCRAMIHLLKEKLAEMKVFLQSHSFKNEVDEIIFFKYQEPTLLGRLIYSGSFHPTLHWFTATFMRWQIEDKYVFVAICRRFANNRE